GKLTLAELTDRYASTIQHQAPKTIERKLLIIHRIKSQWPTGRLTQIAKIRPSHVDLWLSRYHFGSASRNLFISCIKEIFALALRDRIIATSPAAHLVTQSARSGFVPHRALKSSKQQSSKPSARRNTTVMMHK